VFILNNFNLQFKVLFRKNQRQFRRLPDDQLNADRSSTLSGFSTNLSASAGPDSVETSWWKM